MSQPQLVKKIPIAGMTCTGCETRIEGALTALPGVIQAQASAKDGVVSVTYNPSLVTLKNMQKVIEDQGYTIGEAKKPESHQPPGIAKTAGISALVLAFFLLGSRFGWFQVFNLFPVANSETSFGMLFVIGLLTSVHCVAMCGGINLSQCIGGNGQGRFSGLLPSLKYNLGRVISYTIIGGIVGAIGSVVQFTGTLRGMVQILAGVFMVLMGFSLSGLFPAFYRLTPHLPKALGRRINKEKRESNSPLYVGLLNGLMPCGPLQAMQLYALSTGSAVNGAISMLLFSLGTVPLMFALGALSSILSRKFTHHMMTAGAVLVAVMGISMFQSGLALSGVNLGSGTAQSQPLQTAPQQVEATKASVQEITSELSRYGYPAITVKAGIPVKWTIKADKKNLNGCNNAIVIPEYNLQKAFEVGDNFIEFTPTHTGTFTYTCWMGMIRSTITVTEGDAIASTSSTDVEPATQAIVPAFNLWATPDPDAITESNAKTDTQELVLQSGGCCD